MGAHSGNTHKATPTEMPDTKFKLHQTNISAPPPPPPPLGTAYRTPFATATTPPTCPTAASPGRWDGGTGRDHPPSVAGPCSWARGPYTPQTIPHGGGGGLRPSAHTTFVAPAPPLDGGAPPSTAPVSGGGGGDASEGQGPQRRLGRRLEEVAKAVGGGYCRLQTPVRLALRVRGTGAGHRLGARGGGPAPLPMHRWGGGSDK